MDDDEFWAIIDAARYTAGDRRDYRFEDRYVEGLGSRLDHLDPDGLLDFQIVYDRLHERADTPTVRAAAWVMDRDRNAEHLISAVIAMGRDEFERVVVDPDRLAEDPVVRAIAAEELYVQSMFYSWATDVAESRHRKRTGSGPARFRELVDERWAADWAGRDGEAYAEMDEEDVHDEDASGAEAVEDEEEEPPSWNYRDEREVRRHLPRLTALFDWHIREVDRAARRKRVRDIVVLTIVLVLGATCLVLLWVNGLLPEPD